MCSQDCTNREEELRKAGSLNTRHSSNGLSDEPVDDQEVEGEGDQGNQQLKIVCDLHWSRRDNCFFVSILKQDDDDDNDDSPCTLSQFGTLRKVKTTMIAKEQR